VGWLHDPQYSGDPSDDPHRLLDGPSKPGPTGYVPGDPVPGEVVIYFGDDPRCLYQLKQWLPVFERLHHQHAALVVTRHPKTYTELCGLTSLRCVLAPAFADLVDLYESGEHKVAIYVNNSVHNFQSLVARHMLHVHVNHGESDKICMVSNQVKAYDRVFVAGDAAVRRHRTALIEFDERRLVPVGQPQLDLSPAPVLPPTGRRTVLYAPTWEGENSSNNYTSVDMYGLAIVTAALAVPEVRVVYKPHPRVAISPDPRVAAGHREIVRLLEQAARCDPTADHRVETSSDILAVLPGCDLMITDVSSVGIDFLYLHTDKPLFVTDRDNDREWLNANAPVSRCADVVDAGSLGALPHALAARLDTDEHRAARETIRRYYFGDLAPGESTRRFLAAVDETLATRDQLVGCAPNEESPTVAHLGDVQIAILAAGTSTQLGLASPKPLTPLDDGRRILGQQLDNLRQSFGDGAHINVVVGFKADLVMSAFPDVPFVYNERYGETNTAKSLLRALRASRSGGLLWLNGDVVFDAALVAAIRSMVDADRTFVCVNTAPVGENEVKYLVDADGFVTALSKTVTGGLGEAVGINYVASADKAKLIEHLDRCSDQDYFERGIESAIFEEGLRVLALDVSDYFVVNVDFADDLERANAEVSKTVTSAA
jgi:choline kinase